MDIKEHIKKIGEYFTEMQIVTVDGQQVIYVIVSFPADWVIDTEIEEKFNVTVSRGGQYPGQYYFCADIDTGEEQVFNAIEYNIEKMKSAIERARLLKSKIKELTELFQNEEIPLDSLRNMTFNYTETSIADVLPKKQGKIKSTEKETKKDE